MVYGLYDPLGHLRYIGKTVHEPAQRLGGHMTPSMLRRPTPVARWISKLLAQGQRPVIRVLVAADTHLMLDNLEKAWIADARASGLNMLNLTDGGAGSWGIKRSDEMKAKLRAFRTGMRASPELRAKLSALKKGRPLGRSPEHAAKLGALKRGIPLSDEHRAKLAISRRGERNGRAKLTTKDVEQIRSALACREKMTKIAARFGVSPQMIGFIKRGKNWKP